MQFPQNEYDLQREWIGGAKVEIRGGDEDRRFDHLHDESFEWEALSFSLAAPSQQCNYACCCYSAI
ncbi:hypothetical protein Scep_004766 [Stephania cephalantha]|uniref:Uncharacterized protein n=1 Tax=Stephania cephalantha TaxID=152367 RepID=A0AAP0KUS4_9MAGN